MRPVLVPAVLALAVLPGCAAAGELFAGGYVHDVDDGFSLGDFEEGAQVIVGARTTALDELKFIRRPRVHLLAAVNTAGGTNYLATGLSWRFDLGERVYIQPGFGVGVHDGKVGLPSPNAPGISEVERQRRLRDELTKLDLGSRVLFQQEVSVGWKASRRLSVELSWIHLSHGQIAGGQNPGLTDVGLRFLYRYGLDR